MKRKISKEEYEKLSDVLKAEYKEKSGSYILDIADDDEAIEALRRAKENEAAEHKETKRQMKALQDQMDELKGVDNRKRGDIEAIEKSWQDKLTKRETELTTQLSAFKTMVANAAKDSVISGLAAKLVKPESHRLFKKSVEERFHVEMNGEAPTVRILGTDGKPSAMSLEEFEKEVLANKEYSPIIIASRASGGTQKPDRKGGPSGNATDNGTPLNLASMNPKDLAAAIKLKKSEQEN